MKENIQQRIVDHLKPVSAGLKVIDVRIGLGYTSVRLDNGSIGLSWTAKNQAGSCTHEAKAGSLGGMGAGELLEMLVHESSPLSRTLGLAAANALAAGLPRPASVKEDVLDILNIQSPDHVAMAGFFGPLIPKLKKTGCRLDILELDSSKPGTMPPEEGKAPLAACTVAIITATSIVTGTIDELLAGLGRPRAAVILGPSSLMCPQVFAGTPVTHIAGARVLDAAAAEKIVSEGGGTMILKKYLDFETICL